jgi:hypothetical protein
MPNPRFHPQKLPRNENSQFNNVEEQNFQPNGTLQKYPISRMTKLEMPNSYRANLSHLDIETMQLLDGDGQLHLHNKTRDIPEKIA